MYTQPNNSCFLLKGAFRNDLVCLFELERLCTEKVARGCNVFINASTTTADCGTIWLYLNNGFRRRGACRYVYRTRQFWRLRGLVMARV